MEQDYKTKIKLAHMGVAVGFITEKDLSDIKRKLRLKLKQKQTQTKWKYLPPPKDEFYNRPKPQDVM